MNPGSLDMHNNTDIVPGEGYTSSKKSHQAVKRKLQRAAERDYQRIKTSKWESPVIELTAAVPSGISAVERSVNPKAVYTDENGSMSATISSAVQHASPRGT